MKKKTGSADWRTVYLRALGAKPTSQAMDLLARWQPFEGGHTNNDARYNYLNTTQRMPGSRAINSVGVQAYSSLAQGAQAFARTLTSNPHYAPLVAFLKGAGGDPSPGLQTWVSGSPTGNPDYAAKVIGGGVAPAAAVSVPQDFTAPTMEDGFTPLTTPGVGDQVKTAAIAGLGKIAAGRKATDQFAETAKLMRSLATSHPQVKIPTLAEGGTSLDQQASALVHKYLGVKYTWGGTSAATGFDCSGLVQTVWKQLGVNVPRTSQEQWKAGTPVDTLAPGDAVFFVGSDGTVDDPGHEGMYIGNGKYIAAPHTGAVVSVFSLADAKDYVGARRFA